MKIVHSLALIVLICAGCTSLRQKEDLFQKIRRTSSIVQVQLRSEVSPELPFVYKKVGVVTDDPEEVKWVVNEISPDRVTPEGPWMGWISYVVFLDDRDRPLALAQLNTGGCELGIMPCIRTWRGYIVPMNSSTIDDFRTLACTDAWQYLYKHLPVIEAENLAFQRTFYKQIGLDPEAVIGSHTHEEKTASTNSIPREKAERK